jgi:MYXO-CTERM domain-containing protein
MGKHHLQIVSQAAGRYETLSAPQALDVELDSERPLAQIDRSGDGLRVSATDLISAPEDIRLELRTVGANGPSAWRASTQGEVLTAAALSGVYSVEVRATDHAGNVSDVAAFAWAAAPPKVVGAGQGCGCRSGGQADLLFLAAGLALFIARSRRRR